jgi:ubiquinone/menaquinone biosynthesis C-methylase UbiE
MDVHEAAELVAPAVSRAGVWADLGAGRGTFTRALATLLGPTGRVYAVDRDRSSLAALRALERRSTGSADSGADEGAEIIAVHADFVGGVALPPLDGVLLANALHFVPATEQPAVLGRLARGVRPGGRLVLVEYENRAPSRWVSLARFRALAAEVGLGAPKQIGARRSAFGGAIYAAVATVTDAPR